MANPGNAWRWRAVCASLLLAVVFLLLPQQQQQPQHQLNLRTGSRGPIITEFMNGHRYIYEMPAAAAASKGMLFLAHGCNCRAEYFWDPSPACPHCIGLPHDRVYARQAVNAGYAVIAISSVSRCWSAAVDGPATAAILVNFRSRHKHLATAPAFAIGASSGGYFVSQLAAASVFNFSAIVIMIAEGTYRESMQLPTDHPATLFVHMPRDERRAHGVSRSMSILRSRSVQVSEIKCFPVEVHPLYFAERIPGLDGATSRRIVAAFKEDGLLDGRGFATVDGRSMDWKSSLRKRNLVLPRLTIGDGDGSTSSKYIQEELNVAYAFHELTSLPAKQVFQWLQQHGS